MQSDRSTVLSIAGLDPSAGAGLLADIKTFEQHKVYGLGICTAQTVQTESEFLSVKWEHAEDVIFATEKMLLHYNVKVVKIGITKSIDELENIVLSINNVNPDIKIIVDPVIKSGTGYNFWKGNIDKQKLENILSKIYLLTPNFEEIILLDESLNAKETAKKISAYCNVLLKGGHNHEEPGTDYLFAENEIEKLDPSENINCQKHGSGCVLSAAITANLALGLSLSASCRQGKKYIESFLNSNESRLGYHVQ